MKTQKLYIVLSILIITFTNCVKDDNFTNPEITITEPTEIAANAALNGSISKIQTDLIQEYNLNGSIIYTYRENDTPTYISGYVVSNSAAGNFYQTLIVQDEIENPTAGIEIIISSNTLSETYSFGQKVYIKLDGLSVSYDDGEFEADPNLFGATGSSNVPGKFSLGLIDHTGQVESIPSTTYRDYVVKSPIVETIIPTSIKLEEIEQKHINTLVTLENAQFEKSQIGKTFSNELNDTFDGFRTIFECESQATIFLQTSTFASFNSNTIPSGKGKATAILSKDYRAELFVLIAANPADLNFSNPDRCDPPVLECGTVNPNGSVIVYDENFDGISSTSALSSSGWTNTNTNGGSNSYNVRTRSGNKYVEISAYNSGEDPMEVWLVTPAIHLDTSSDEILSFDTRTGYNNGAALSVWISSDFTGDVTTATWIQLDAELADGPSNDYQANNTNSGELNISCLSGNVHVAFKYLGADGGVTTTFQIDNVTVTGH
ncbi:DUF5689 domain-containing protein [Tenacibaculum aquimarinum]|uniref:DUF5689 domain-containing protein n=1 Tax=Tenacibaculum aquimarinum TaxID=2910675 RepID=UPI001F0A7FB2|nr:DUF5689 domain-containing protein [Tenacibaculum aquimarinum]MCH3883631.1 DUF5689 domain-containing protein [Tenacibaculum aquimarinum]